jgi:drug/metabolite transporter (DMT)-like permease
MPDIVFAILGGLVLCIFGAFGVCALVRPSHVIRWHRNPWMEDTPWVRLQLRGVGLVFCVAILMVVTGILGGNTKSEPLEGFHQNLLMALWVAFIVGFVGGAISLILWRFTAFRLLIRSHFRDEKINSPGWEQRLTILFCSLLASITAIAYLLAARGYHP